MTIVYCQCAHDHARYAFSNFSVVLVVYVTVREITDAFPAATKTLLVMLVFSQMLFELDL